MDSNQRASLSMEPRYDVLGPVAKVRDYRILKILHLNPLFEMPKYSRILIFKMVNSIFPSIEREKMFSCGLKRFLLLLLICGFKKIAI